MIPHILIGISSVKIDETSIKIKINIILKIFFNLNIKIKLESF